MTTQGDTLLNADDVRAAFGVNGAGVRVGVISDGVAGLAASQASGDLPAVNLTTCNVVPTNAALKIRPDLGGIRESRDPTWAFAGAEGTAMLEIVHDLAPGAELWFGYFGGYLTNYGTVLDFMAAVNCLAQNVDIVVDDVGFYNVGPYDGTSFVSRNTSDALNAPTNRIGGYYTGVGNDAEGHYQERFVDDGLGFNVFSATSSTFDLAGFGPRSDNPVLIPAGSLAIIYLQWNDPFGASCNNYDLAAWLHDTATLIAASVNVQDCFQDPVEMLVLVNDLGFDAVVDITIFNFSAAPRTFDMFVYPPINIPNFFTPSSSVANNADARDGVIALGAIDAADPGTDDIEPYSSRGPTNDGRTKPDAVAVDRVSVTGNGGFGSPFFGTSAAAPHAAGIAALVLDCAPELTRAQLRARLLNTAIDLGPPGPDNDFGWGRLDALNAVASANCRPTPTNTPPAVNAGPDVKVTLGQPVNRTASFTDDGGPHTCRVNWADGTTAEPAVSQNSGGTEGSCTASRTYAAAGIYIAQVCINDAKHQTGCDQFRVRVNSQPIPANATIPPGMPRFNCTVPPNLFGTADYDCDGLPDVLEQLLRIIFPGICLDWRDWDSDDDRVSDGAEFYLRTNPCNRDTDRDGIWDGDELLHRTASGFPCLNPISPDTDGDGAWDGVEAFLGINPCRRETDGDGLSDGAELYISALRRSSCPDPHNPDSDNDGATLIGGRKVWLTDGAELYLRTDPCDARSPGRSTT